MVCIAGHDEDDARLGRLAATCVLRPSICSQRSTLSAGSHFTMVSSSGAACSRATEERTYGRRELA